MSKTIQPGMLCYLTGIGVGIDGRVVQTVRPVSWNVGWVCLWGIRDERILWVIDALWLPYNPAGWKVEPHNLRPITGPDIKEAVHADAAKDFKEGIARILKR